jgi:hypothetical protein
VPLRYAALSLALSCLWNSQAQAADARPPLTCAASLTSDQLQLSCHMDRAVFDTSRHQPLRLALSFGVPAPLVGSPSFANQADEIALSSEDDCASPQRFGRRERTAQQVEDCRIWFRAARASQTSELTRFMRYLEAQPRIAGRHVSFEMNLPVSSLPWAVTPSVDRLWLWLPTETEPSLCIVGTPSPEAPVPSAVAVPVAHIHTSSPSPWLTLVAHLNTARLAYSLTNPGQVRIYSTPIEGYQYEPARPFPNLTDLDLAKARALFVFAGKRILTTPVAPAFGDTITSGLFSVEDDRIIDALTVPDFELFSRAVGQAGATERLVLLSVAERATNPLRTGSCGSCPRAVLSAIELDSSGRFSTPLWQHEELIDGGHTWKVSATPDLAQIELSIQDLERDAGEKVTQHRIERFRYDQKLRTYVRVDSPHTQDSSPRPGKRGRKRHITAGHPAP